RRETSHDIDEQDLEIVLKFMRDVAHRCLDNTEEILRLASLEQHVLNHDRARAAFQELTNDIAADQFISACRLYTDLVAHSINDDRRCVSVMDCDPLILSQFYEWEREIDEIARQYGQVLWQLEEKYTAPHCI